MKNNKKIRKTSPHALSDKIEIIGEYSTTPQRIGTWIDGTPIWRWAFCYKLKDYFDDKEAYDTFRNLDKNIDVLLPILDYGGKIIELNSAACFQQLDVERPNLIDGFALQTYGRYLEFPFSSNLPEWSSLENEGVLGYIEFATPNSNLKFG